MLRTKVVLLAAAGIAAGIYLAAANGCEMGRQPGQGHASYGPFTLVFLSCLAGLPALLAHTNLPKLTRLLLLLTSPITLFYGPLLLLGVVQAHAQRLCTAL